MPSGHTILQDDRKEMHGCIWIFILFFAYSVIIGYVLEIPYKLREKVILLPTIGCTTGEMWSRVLF